MKKSRSSKQWLRNHEQDAWVKRARQEGYRSRAAYKLLEINEKFGLIEPGMTIVDLGAAPGGWSQVAAELAGDRSRIVAVDLLQMPPIPGVAVIQGDFTEDDVFEELLSNTEGLPVDLVISDMAPNLSGMKDIDQPRAALLVELALDYANRVLRPGGSLVCKCFEGEGIEPIRTAFRKSFEKVKNFKPASSRPKSREIYLIGRDFTGSGGQ
ncbi:MAG: RlmE family RNA methyltransferase [Pseudomonadales bacterium]|nr:RlmE family RNA methyltransferase [Pseudomonadales bacterium]